MIDLAFIVCIVLSCCTGLVVGHSQGRDRERKSWRSSLEFMSDKEWEEHRKMFL